MERERQLKEVQRLYLNLRQVLAQQPSPSVKEELNKTQKALRLRGNKLKVKQHVIIMQISQYFFGYILQ